MRNNQIKNLKNLKKIILQKLIYYIKKQMINPKKIKTIQYSKKSLINKLKNWRQKMKKLDWNTRI